MLAGAPSVVIIIATRICRAKAKAAAAYASEEVGERSTKDRVKARARQIALYHCTVSQIGACRVARRCTNTERLRQADLYTAEQLLGACVCQTHLLRLLKAQQTHLCVALSPLQDALVRERCGAVEDVLHLPRCKFNLPFRVPPPLQDALEAMEDVREYDVPFHMRWAIDTGVRCGWWYTVKATVRLHPPCSTHTVSHECVSSVTAVLKPENPWN
jgi:DNA polymerase elongation subunit (family B)